MLFVPYCTGDDHTGNQIMSYTAKDGRQVIVHHKGFVNAGSAIGWAMSNYPDVRDIYLTGCSSGSILPRVNPA
jgi:hypothetical protein